MHLPGLVEERLRMLPGPYADEVVPSLGAKTQTMKRMIAFVPAREAWAVGERENPNVKALF